MYNLSLNKDFIYQVNFLENILLLDSFDNTKKIYNMFVNYLKKDNYYILKLNVLDGDNEIVKTECNLANKKNGSIVINDIITLITKKYYNDLIIDVKELDTNNNCIKFGRRTYNAKKK